MIIMNYLYSRLDYANINVYEATTMSMNIMMSRYTFIGEEDKVDEDEGENRELRYCIDTLLLQILLEIYLYMRSYLFNTTCI